MTSWLLPVVAAALFAMPAAAEVRTIDGDRSAALEVLHKRPFDGVDLGALRASPWLPRGRSTSLK